MSSYPPPPPQSPPPPPPGGPYPPYDRRYAQAQQKAQQQAARAQQRAQQAAWKAQYRAQRAAYKLERRSMRRSSIVGPLILLALGTVLLLATLGRISWGYSLQWFGRWWPAVLIFAGAVLLVEWAIDQRRGEGVASRTLGGGVVALLILIAFFGIVTHAVERGIASSNVNLGEDIGGLDQVLGVHRDAYDDMTSAITTGEVLVVNDPHGDVEVTGSSTDGQVHVSVHKQTHAWNERDTQKMANNLEPRFSTEGKVLTLAVAEIRGGSADLTITVPATTAVTVNADHGDINVSELQAAVTLSANHGDVTATEIQGDVQATVNDDDADVKLSEIRGALVLNGHTGDVDVSELRGPLTMHGDFYGTTHLQHIAGTVAFDTSRTHFSAERLDDEFSVEKDSLDASGLLGPVILKTADKNITLDRVQGSVDVTNSNGDVNVTDAADSATINIQNRHGSIDLGLPAAASFVLDAQTRNGDMENDFGLSTQDNGDNHSLHGTVGSRGGKITLATSDGDVTVRKSSVAPLPPSPPSPPSVPSEHPGAAPRVPKVPPVPAAPKSYTF